MLSSYLSPPAPVSTYYVKTAIFHVLIVKKLRVKIILKNWEVIYYSVVLYQTILLSLRNLKTRNYGMKVDERPFRKQGKNKLKIESLLFFSK